MLWQQACRDGWDDLFNHFGWFAMTRYPLAKQGVFRTVQGEGALLGLPMTFVRLAGCSIGCPLCDTDYAVRRKATADEITAEVLAVASVGEWVWITGGEPTDHDLDSLVKTLGKQFRVALATAGHRKVDVNGLSWLSVSPHDPGKWVQDVASEVKLVPSLNGCCLNDFEHKLPGRFEHRYVSPCDGRPETVAECVRWLDNHPGWRMTVQAHKSWGLA